MASRASIGSSSWIGQVCRCTREAKLNFDGLIADPASWFWLTKKSVPKIPAVTVTGDPVPKGPPAVIADNESVGRMGADHLIDAGLKHLG